MDDKALRELAVDATSQLARVAIDAAYTATVARGSAMPTTTSSLMLQNLGKLSGALASVSQTLQKMDGYELNSISAKLSELLFQLEKSCTWPLKGANIAQGIALYPALQTAKNPSKNYRAELEAAFTKFAKTGGDEVTTLLSKLSALSSTEPLQYRHIVENAEPPVEYDSDLNRMLYTALQHHSRCTCSVNTSQPSVGQRHQAWLRLSEKVRNHAGGAFFDVRFYVERKWFQTRFHVSEIKKARKTVGFANEVSLGPTSTNEDEDDESNRTMIQSLCSLFVEEVGPVWIRLKIINDSLYNFHQPDPDDTEYVLTSAPSLPLSMLLEEGRISSKDRILLGYILAKSVWRYYNSKFMSEAWTTESVQFMEKKYYDSSWRLRIDLQDPLFALHWEEGAQTEVAEHSTARNIWFRYPRVLALGVLLVEIGRKAPRPDADDQPISTADVDMNTQWKICMMISKSDNWPELDFRNREIANTYRAAAQYCLDPKNFHVSSSDLSTWTSQADIRRTRLYQNVVYSLEQLCKDAAIMKSTDQSASQEYYTVEHKDQGSKAAFLDMTTSRLLPTSPETWMNWAMSPWRGIDLGKEYRGKPKTRRIRIAVLDTGYNKQTTFFDTPPRFNRLKRWKDFTEEKHAEAVDCDGHGTYVLSLAMKMAPVADFFVARVARNTEDLVRSSNNIARAIRWAAEKEVEADIISMSFGFPEEPTVKGEYVISDAISHALKIRSQRITFFAAAANDGGNQSEMFPAQHPNVFSIRATDHNGHFLGLNPPPDFGGVDVFGTLGKDVPGAGLARGQADVLKTGTSIATPIAAGIAATILGYAQLRLHDQLASKRDLLQWLWREQGMRRILWRASRQMRSKQRYLTPHDFISSADNDSRDAMLVEAAQQAKQNYH